MWSWSCLDPTTKVALRRDPLPVYADVPLRSLADRVELLGLAPHLLELPGLQAPLDVLVDLGLGRPHPPQAHGIQSLELEDLEHIDQVHGGGDHEDAERDYRGCPARVEVAVVVGVGHEAQGHREAAEQDRPRVEVEHGPALAEADAAQAVVEVV